MKTVPVVIPVLSAVLAELGSVCVITGEENPDVLEIISSDVMLVKWVVTSIVIVADPDVCSNVPVLSSPVVRELV